MAKMMTSSKFTFYQVGSIVIKRTCLSHDLSKGPRANFHSWFQNWTNHNGWFNFPWTNRCVRKIEWIDGLNLASLFSLIAGSWELLNLRMRKSGPKGLLSKKEEGIGMCKSYSMQPHYWHIRYCQNLISQLRYCQKVRTVKEPMWDIFQHRSNPLNFKEISPRKPAQPN